MNKPNHARQAALCEALMQLETVMQQDGIWPKEQISEQERNSAMESAVPFAVDCLAFESWLAFIFIPKMRVLLKLEQHIPLMQITPAAQIYLPKTQQRTISQCQKIDDISNGDIG
ncbi:YqcC family protein [Alteromonas gracilis]|uniref:YqcC family protein n=1 Tax=Alteromonas gracilis TaxID=1479524 RepID=UPI003736CE6D